MSKQFGRLYGVMAVFFLSLLTFSAANANSVYGDHLGTFDGNDSVEDVLAVIGPLDSGQFLIELAKIETGDTDGGLMIDPGIDDVTSGEWWLDSDTETNYIVWKAGNEWALFDVTSHMVENFDGTFTGHGEYDTTMFGLDGSALSHITAYSVVPVPAAVWLFGSGLLGMVGIARRRKTA